MTRLAPGQRWVIGLGCFALLLLVVGLVAVVSTAVNDGWCLVSEDGSEQTWETCATDRSGFVWGGVLAIIGLLHLGLTGLAGALVWTSTPTIGPRPDRTALQVFAVGDLRGSAAQDALLGRVLRTSDDTLSEWVLVDGTARPGTPDDSIAGSLLRLDAQWQLDTLDRHAGAGMRRERVRLASGETAWVFTASV